MRHIARNVSAAATPILVLLLVGCGGDDNKKRDGGGDAPNDVASEVGSSDAHDAAPADATPDTPSDAAPSDAPADAPPSDAPSDKAMPTDAPADTTSDTASSDASDSRLDLSGVPPPSMLTVNVIDRRKAVFQLVWTAPAGVSGYQVRYAKAAITTANFNDSAVTTAVLYVGTPAAAGTTDGLQVPLYIENAYYFAVVGTDAGGNQIGATFMTTSTAVAAHFNITTLVSGATANEALGFSISAEDDVNGDGLSDVLVGTALAGKAYLFLGSASVTAAPPAVTFTGAATGFGLAVAQIGDIDHDGKPDIAISDPPSLKVFIYKGRTTWPATLTDAQADYVISTADASYTGSNLGSALSRLGDFTGDGVDDFAIGARGFSSNVGRVLVVKGKSGFASVSLPDTTNTIVIDGDSTLGTPYFGYRVLGIGHFYSGTGTTLVVSAPARAATGASAVYAFRGQTGTAGVIALSAADAMLPGGAGAHLGSILTSVAPRVASAPAVGLGNPTDNTGPTANGTGYLLSGSPTVGPFATRLTLTLAGANQAGGFVIGGSIPGVDVTASILGDATPDVVFGPKTGTKFTIFDGAKLASKSGTVEASTAAEVVLPLSFTTGEGQASLIKDINGDGWADFCVGTGVGSVPGSVIVYW